MRMSDRCDAVSFQTGLDSIMPKCLRFSQNKITPVDNKSNSEQLPDVDTEELSPPKIRRCPSSPMRIPANCNRDAALLCQSMRYISAYCGIGRTPSDAWWALPDIRASLKRHRQHLLRPSPPRHPANRALSSSVGGGEHPLVATQACSPPLGFGSSISHALVQRYSRVSRAVP
jgi:hypothetical protein